MRVNIPRHDSDFAAIVGVRVARAGASAGLWPRRDHAWTIWPDQVNLALRRGRCGTAIDLIEKRSRPNHVLNWDAFGDRTDHADPSVGCFDDRVRRQHWWHKDHGRVRACCFHGLVHSVEDGQAIFVFGTAFAGRDAADHFGAIVEAPLCMLRAKRAGDALANDKSLSVDEDCHMGGSLAIPAALGQVVSLLPKPDLVASSLLGT